MILLINISALVLFVWGVMSINKKKGNEDVTSEALSIVYGFTVLLSTLVNY